MTRTILLSLPLAGALFIIACEKIAVTPPYMHGGRFQILEVVIDHYNAGIKESLTVDPTVLKYRPVSDRIRQRRPHQFSRNADRRSVPDQRGV